MSRKGIKNKRTLIREQRMLEAAKNAARTADRSADSAVLLDSLGVMEAGMRYFLGRFQAESAEKKPDWGKADAALLQADGDCEGHHALSSSTAGHNEIGARSERE